MITLKTLPQATEQEVFDQVATHLLTQNKKSRGLKPRMDEVGVCAYRGDGGEGKPPLMCAAGCLIGDDEYDGSFEMRNWRSLQAEGRVPIYHMSLICQLQNVHDIECVFDWPYWLKRIAENNELSSKVVDEFKRST